MTTGKFVFISIKEVPAGQNIEVEIEWYGNNPEFNIWNPFDPYWKCFLVADSSPNFRLVLDDTNEMQRDFSRKRKFSLGKMPDKQIAITFSLWWHHATGYDWNWNEYQNAVYGYKTEIECLARETRVVKPGTAPAGPQYAPQTLEVDITPRAPAT
jgi:hypothetical protein